jgi:hypothetical protein
MLAARRYSPARQRGAGCRGGGHVGRERVTKVPCCAVSLAGRRELELAFSALSLTCLAVDASCRKLLPLAARIIPPPALRRAWTWGSLGRFA